MDFNREPTALAHDWWTPDLCFLDGEAGLISRFELVG